MDLAPPTDARPDWDPGNFVDALSSLSCSPGHSCAVFVTLQGVLPCWRVALLGRHCQWGVVVMRGCTWLVAVFG